MFSQIWHTEAHNIDIYLDCQCVFLVGQKMKPQISLIKELLSCT